MTTLSPQNLYTFGFNTALDALAEEIEIRYGLHVEIEIHGEEIRPDDELLIFLYRAVRELLINVAKHAGVENAQVTVENEAAYFCVRVADEGTGFDPQRRESEQSGGGFGLFSLRERLRYYGGIFDLQSAPGKGTQVSLKMSHSQHSAQTEGTSQS